MKVLPKVATQGDERAIIGVCNRLEGADLGVRRSALVALSPVPEKGDERAIAGVCSRLEDSDPFVLFYSGSILAAFLDIV